MNSQIFQTNKNMNDRPIMTLCLTPWQNTMFQWLSVLIFAVAVILFPERPAWGADADIHVGPEGIRGFAHQAELGEVMELLADEGGFAIYLDETLVRTRVTFNIPNAIPAQRAIEIIVQPHSSAVVFTDAPERTLQIHQIRIFYANPATADEEASKPTASTVSDDESSDDKKILALPIAYDNEAETDR